jgi:hypothetical protein
MAAEYVKVSEVYLVKEDDRFTGIEMGWSDSVLNAQGAASVLDTLNNAMMSAGWVTKMVMRASGGDGDGETDAPADEGAAAADDEAAGGDESVE